MAEKIGHAPGALAILQSFVNTLDIEQSADELADPAALQTWLDRNGLRGDPSDGRPATGADLAVAIRLREALRKVLRSHVRRAPADARQHQPADAQRHRSADPQPAETAEAAADLRELAVGLPTRLKVDDDGRIRPVPAGSGVEAALARILLIAAEAATLGTWARLKICSADDCQWAFYDRSPTRNGCWCSMQICGSRAKSRVYRSRVAARAGQQRPTRCV